MKCLSREAVTRGQTSRKYFSRYLGKRVAKEDSSRRRPPGRVSPSVGFQGVMDQ